MQVEQLLRTAHAKQASDIHITVNSPILFRIHGELCPAFDEVLKPQDTLAIARQLMNDERYKTLLRDGDIDFSHGIAGLARFRINAYKQRGSVL
jgi:twitching motility protein PilT